MKGKRNEKMKVLMFTKGPPVLHPNVRSEIIIVLEVMLGNTIGYFGSFSGDFYSFLS